MCVNLINLYPEKVILLIEVLFQKLKDEKDSIIIFN